MLHRHAVLNTAAAFHLTARHLLSKRLMTPFTMLNSTTTKNINKSRVAQVEQQMPDGSWSDCKQLNQLGQQFVLNQCANPDNNFTLRVRCLALCPYLLSTALVVLV